MSKKIFAMPSFVRERILFALQPVNITPYQDPGDALMYRLEYESGLVLTVGIVCVETSKFVFGKKREIWIAVLEKDDDMKTREHHLSKYIPLPKSEHDIFFDAGFMSSFVAMTCAVADTLGAGTCLSMKTAA